MAAPSRNYFRVGLFVFGALLLIIAGIIVLGGGTVFQKTITLETYVEESVQGLDVGSAVRYRGVKVGAVSQITFVGTAYKLTPDDPRYFQAGQLVAVRMRLDVDAIAGGQASGQELEGIMRRLVTNGLRVRLASQGVTGTSYLEVDYVPPERNPALQISWTPDFFYLPSAPSVISRLSSAVEQVFTRLEEADLEKVVVETGLLLSELRETNRRVQVLVGGEKVTAALSDVAESAKHIRSLAASADDTVGHVMVDLREITMRLNTFSQEIATQFNGATMRAIAQGVRDTVADLRTSVAALPDMVATAGRTTRRADSILATGQQDLEGLLVNLAAISQNLRELTETAKRYPSQLLFGQPPRRSEP
ncbi:phospholipid/cholesterol/gamma-HCH transport system substrate-binding protein/paraquat-inducible protein B [Stella humosa]|uniref:Phospholipid/cholesterol/gamma-HCH transport system substrate-binding protein/paraquat-inducible protein B n=1 Tax=Stella humosa TaxID=94 RepID=A0A3N1KZT0_9PROT|nr:MlaD family protein [Stella humosa]ROP83838.1 phospholipid/cholesterol/gamma-HCH transport system substrate-binding protein/paraquat-inducible protein B [Stella humosa]BBK32901.1 mammalian cell entry protein [Stella humosa]